LRFIWYFAFELTRFVCCAAAIVRLYLPQSVIRGCDMKLQVPAVAAACLALASSPTLAAPASIAFVGDSMSDGIWGAFFRMTGGGHCSPGELTLIRDARNGTGLARPDHFDWTGELDALVGKDAPTLVFAAIGLNDAQDLVMPDKTKFKLGSDGWLAQYKQNVADFYEHAGKGGAPVVIMGLPNLRDDGAERHAELVNGIYHDVAANERDVSVTYIAPWHLTNDDGSFAAFGNNLNGQTVQIRAPDGLHFTQAGYDVLARYLEPTVTQALAAAHVKLSDTCLGG
jgi:hypothetical protein